MTPWDKPRDDAAEINADLYDLSLSITGYL